MYLRDILIGYIMLQYTIFDLNFVLDHNCCWKLLPWELFGVLLGGVWDHYRQRLNYHKYYCHSCPCAAWPTLSCGLYVGVLNCNGCAGCLLANWRTKNSDLQLIDVVFMSYLANTTLYRSCSHYIFQAGLWYIPRVFPSYTF